MLRTFLKLGQCFNFLCVGCWVGFKAYTMPFPLSRTSVLMGRWTSEKIESHKACYHKKKSLQVSKHTEVLMITGFFLLRCFFFFDKINIIWYDQMNCYFLRLKKMIHFVLLSSNDIRQILDFGLPFFQMLVFEQNFLFFSYPIVKISLKLSDEHYRSREQWMIVLYKYL